MKYFSVIVFSLFFGFFLGCEAGIGDSCSTSNDCPTGTVCDTDSPSGYCLAAGCELDDECPEKSVCVEFTKTQRYCLKKCKKDSDCRGGYSCRSDVPATTPFCYVATDHAYGRSDSMNVEFVVDAAGELEEKADDSGENAGDSE